MERPTRDQTIALVPACVLGLGALAAGAYVDMLPLRIVLMAIASLAIAAVAWYVGSTDRRSAQPAAPMPIRQVQAIAADRRRPTFDAGTGLLAEWYFRLRVDEEIARARRYEGPFTLLVFSSGAVTTMDVARVATRQYLREVDFAGDLGDALVLCLPQTGRQGAETVVARLTKLVKGLDVRVAEFPADGETLNTLLGDAEWRVRPAQDDLEQMAS
jgi:hypothetical protein